MLLGRFSLKKQKTKTKYLDWISNAWVIILGCLILLAIPVFIVGSQIYEQYQSAGKPMYGDRYKNDLPTKITNDQLKDLENSIKSAFTEVERVEVSNQSSLVKIVIDAVDTIDGSIVNYLLEESSKLVDSKLPLSQYFTSTDAAKNYDLEIMVVDKLSEPTKLSIYTKNGTMATGKIQDLLTPKDPATVEAIRALELEEKAQEEQQGETEGQS